MNTGTILLLLLLVTLVAACTKTAPETQGTVQANIETTNTTTTDNITLVIEDENLEAELISDPLEDIGTLDEIPVDDSIPG